MVYGDIIFKDIELFYKKIWEASYPLDQKTIKEYKIYQKKHRLARTSHKFETLKSRLKKPDKIVSIETIRELNDGVVFWKLAPSEAASEWSWWKSHISNNKKGFIAIGWNYIGSLKGIITKNKTSFKKEVSKRVTKEESDSYPNYVAGQFWMFCNEIRKEDFIIAYSNRHIFGISKVDSPYYFDKKDYSKKHFAHKRDVNWKLLINRVPPKHIMSIIATNDTIHPIRDFVLIKYLKELIKPLDI